MDCRQYGGITESEKEKLRQDLRKEGLQVPEGDDVVIQGPHKVEIRAIYVPQKETLRLCIIKKPWWLPASRIWEILDAGVAPYVGP